MHPKAEVLEILPYKGEKCIVFKCSNHTNQGKFVDAICLPCFKMITTGRLGPSDSFLGEIKGLIDKLSKF